MSTSHTNTPDKRLDLVKRHLVSTQRLLNKVAVITGCNSSLGIGIATANRFAQCSAKAVYICDNNDSNLGRHKSDLTASYPNTDIIVRKLDAADENSIKQLIKDVLHAYGRLDIYFANAAILGSQLVQGITADDFMETLRVNTLSVFLAIKHASTAMQVTSKEKRTAGGSIIANASLAGLRSGAGGPDYSASKAAVISLVQTGSWQLSGTNIRVNAICPGLIETGMTEPLFDIARKRGTENKIGQLNPLKRYGVASEVANMALFLASDESSYCNSGVYTVDGGLGGSHPVVPRKQH